MKNKIVETIIDVSTHHREMTYDFVEQLINKKEWVKSLYDKRARKLAKFYLNKYGVRKTRNIIKSLMVKNGYDDFN